MPTQTKTTARTTSPALAAAVAAQTTRTLAQLIAARQTQFEGDEERSNWLSRVRDIVRYVRCDLTEWANESTPAKGASTTSYMYTSKPMIDLERAADAFCGNVFAPSGWFGLEMADPRLAEIDELQNWLEDCEDHLYSVYGNSNFYSAMPVVAMDSLSLGDGILYIGNDLDEGMPFFEYRQPMAVWFKRDRFGRMLTVHEKLSMSAHEAYDRWGKACSEALQLAALTNPAKQFTFLHAVYKANDPILQGFNFLRKRPFMEFWIQEGATENQGHSNLAYEGGTDRMGGIIRQDGYFTMPFVDWPYFLNNGETLGRSPMGSAIYTIKRCHAEHKQMMLAGQRASAPSLWATKTMRGHIDLSPDGVTYLQDTNDKVEELHRNIRYPFGTDQLDRTENEISQTLQLDFFMMFSGITKEMRVDEIIERIGEKAAALAPRIGLMQKLCLDRSHMRIWQIEQLSGRLPQPPDMLRELKARYGIDTSISVRYKGPLASAHEQVFMHRKMASAFQSVAPFAQLDPNVVKAKIDSAKGVEDVFDNAGLANMVRSDEDFEAIMQTQNAAMLDQQNASVAQQQADAVQKVARAGKEASGQ